MSKTLTVDECRDRIVDAAMRRWRSLRAGWMQGEDAARRDLKKACSDLDRAQKRRDLRSGAKAEIAHRKELRDADPDRS